MHPVTLGLQDFVIEPLAPLAVPSAVPMLPELLQEAGYHTACVGKWHLGFYQHQYQPLQRGFDVFTGMFNGDADHFTHVVKATTCARGGSCVVLEGVDFWNGRCSMNYNVMKERGRDREKSRVGERTDDARLWAGMPTVPD